MASCSQVVTRVLLVFSGFQWYNKALSKLGGAAHSQCVDVFVFRWPKSETFVGKWAVLLLRMSEGLVRDTVLSDKRFLFLTESQSFGLLPTPFHQIHICSLRRHRFEAA